MSVGYIRNTVLKCDSCGTKKSFGQVNEMTARLLASRLGWRYAIYLSPETQIENGGRRYQFDACENCKLPKRLQPLEIMTGAV